MAQGSKQNNQSSSNSWIDELDARLRAAGYNFVEGNGEGAMETFFSNPENIIWSNESKKSSKHTNACCRNTARAAAGQTAGPGTQSGYCASSTDKSLQEYKQKVRDCLTRTYKASTTEIENCLAGSDSYWQELLDSGLPADAAAYGTLSGLL